MRLLTGRDSIARAARAAIFGTSIFAGGALVAARGEQAPPAPCPVMTLGEFADRLDAVAATLHDYRTASLLAEGCYAMTIDQCVAKREHRLGVSALDQIDFLSISAACFRKQDAAWRDRVRQLLSPGAPR